MTPLLGLGVALYVAAILYTFITVGKSVGTSDSKKDMSDAITNVTIVNAVLVFVLAGIAWAYIGTNPTAERPYILIMLHVNFLLAIISASIAALQKLDSAAVTPSGSSRTGGGCPA